MNKSQDFLISNVTQYNQVYRLFEKLFENKTSQINASAFNEELQLLALGEDSNYFELERNVYIVFIDPNKKKIKGRIHFSLMISFFKLYKTYFLGIAETSNEYCVNSMSFFKHNQKIFSIVSGDNYYLEIFDTSNLDQSDLISKAILELQF